MYNYKDMIKMSEKIDLERYFRPSKLPVLNDRNIKTEIFENYYGDESSEIPTLPEYLFQTPEDTIINYYSVLREAANSQEEKWAGCGTIGNAKAPYPIAYHFLSVKYQEKLLFHEYLKAFENILHINLIKFQEVPVYGGFDAMRYFVEIETIEGTEKGMASFAYYYAFIDIIKEGNQYKISNINIYPENFLCAPYHGWDYIAEAVVDIKYGEWCSLVKTRIPTQQVGFIKNIYFRGTDGKYYMIQFYQLTNGVDIEIAQYQRSRNGKWELIELDPEKCINK